MATAKNRNTGDTRQRIMDCALQILMESGDGGLTMRQVAEKAGLSLSNVQYYFARKNDLLRAIAAYYFDDCRTILEGYFAKTGRITVRRGLDDFTAFLMNASLDFPEMCQVFRELWAIASRDDEIAGHLADYYGRMFDTIHENIDLADADAEARKDIASILLMVVEGFSIVGPALPGDREMSIARVTRLLNARLDAA